MGLKFETSEESCRYVRAITDKVICPFSLGKDSLATYLHLKNFWEPENIVLVYQGWGIGRDGYRQFNFIERTLRYYEQQLGKRIYRLIHFETLNQLANGVFQPPDRMKIVRHLKFNGTFQNQSTVFANERCRTVRGWENAWVSTGLRMADSLQRRANIKYAGSVIPNTKLFYGIWDWSIDRVLTTITDAGLKLPIDYQWFGRSFDSLGTREIMAIREHEPEDYRTLVQWFPFVETDWKRMEWRPRLLAERAANG